MSLVQNTCTPKFEVGRAKQVQYEYRGDCFSAQYASDSVSDGFSANCRRKVQNFPEPNNLICFDGDEPDGAGLWLGVHARPVPLPTGNFPFVTGCRRHVKYLKERNTVVHFHSGVLREPGSCRN